MSRRSYKELSKLPGWGLYRKGELIASTRATTAEAARKVFDRYGNLPLDGDEVRPLAKEEK